jgi:hypothetical protein
MKQFEQIFGGNEMKWANGVTLKKDYNVSFCPKIIFSNKWIFKICFEFFHNKFL